MFGLSVPGLGELPLLLSRELVGVTDPVLGHFSSGGAFQQLSVGGGGSQGLPSSVDLDRQ